MEQTIRLNTAECNHFRNDKKEILGFKKRSYSDIQIKFIKKSARVILTNMNIELLSYQLIRVIFHTIS